MKTKIFLRVFSMILVFLISNSSDVLGQSNRMDSLIYGKNLEVLNGIIPTYYASQCEKRAKEAQSLLQDLVETYSDNEKNVFNLKLAVLDSSQWNGFYFSYGFFFISRGWIVIPGDLNFQKFANIWGYKNFSDVLKKSLKKLSKDPEEQLTDALYKFTIAHELGHYYIGNILSSSPPDAWTSEWMASYFATDFLYKNDKKALTAFDIFTSTFIKEFEPKYRTLADFNTKYSDVGMENFVWYHSMFQPMIEDIYSKYKKDFMRLFAQTFPRTKDPKKLSQEELLRILDNITGGRTSKWIKIMEGKS